MSLLQSRGEICPRCKRVSIQLITENDNGTGTKICKQCKKEAKHGTNEG